MTTRVSKQVPKRASALIIVLWVAFGLVSLALYFGQSMSFELRAADNRVSALEAEQAIFGTACYVTNVLARLQEPGLIPETNTYRTQDIPIGDARVWLIGRDPRQNYGAFQAWGLVDEGSKLNLNAVTVEMLALLPRMTPELAGAIIDWRDADDEPEQNGAESETYLRQTPAYYAKNTNYESVAELRLVAGMDLDILFGEDGNLNGLLDRNENDSEISLPPDNRDGRLDPGLMEYFTVFTRIPMAGTNINVRTNMLALLSEKIGEQRAQALDLSTNSSILEFYFRSGLTRDEMLKIEGFLMCPTATNALVNINTASEEVLRCIPGIGLELAPKLIAYRQSNPGQLNTIAWIKEALGWTVEENLTDIRLAGPWICGRSFQLTADIAAVGHYGRGYKRVKYVFDTAEGYPKVRFRQDLTYLGWALGRQTREMLLASKTQ